MGSLEANNYGKRRKKQWSEVKSEDSEARKHLLLHCFIKKILNSQIATITGDLAFCASCSTLQHRSCMPTLSLRLNLLQTQPASQTSNFPKQPQTRQHRWRLAPAPELPSPLAVSRPRGFRTANSPLPMAVC